MNLQMGVEVWIRVSGRYQFIVSSGSGRLRRVHYESNWAYRSHAAALAAGSAMMRELCAREAERQP